MTPGPVTAAARKKRLPLAPLAFIAILIVLGLVVLAATAASHASDAATKYLRRAEYVTDCLPAPSAQVTADDCARLATDPPARIDGVEIRDKSILLSYGQAQAATANAIYPVVGLVVAAVSALCALISTGRRDSRQRSAVHSE